MKYMMDTDDVAKKLFKSFTLVAVLVKVTLDGSPADMAAWVCRTVAAGAAMITQANTGNNLYFCCFSLLLLLPLRMLLLPMILRNDKLKTSCACSQAFGLILAAGGGLNIGREGPYTHLGGMVSYQLIRNVPFFNDILKKETVLRQVRTSRERVGCTSAEQLE